MAAIQDGRAVAGNVAIENANKAFRVANVPRSSRNFSVAGTTGAMAAALAANSAICALRLDPGAGSIVAVVERIRVQWTTIAAFTVPITAGRRLSLYRGSGAAASGGLPFATGGVVGKKDSSSIDSEMELAAGGDTRIATTAALTTTGITYEAAQIREMSLSHVGAAGAFTEVLWEFSAHECAPLILQPGQLISIRNPVAMDAGGTWQATINVDWYEALPYSSSIADT